MILVSTLPWHPTRADIVPLRFLPNEPVANAEHDAWKAAEIAARRKVDAENYNIQNRLTHIGDR